MTRVVDDRWVLDVVPIDLEEWPREGLCVQHREWRVHEYVSGLVGALNCKYRWTPAEQVGQVSSDGDSSGCGNCPHDQLAGIRLSSAGVVLCLRRGDVGLLGTFTGSSGRYPSLSCFAGRKHDLDLPAAGDLIVTSMRNDEVFKIGEVAQRTGLRVKTIRYWSDKGVISGVERAHGGIRLYNHEAVLRLKLVRTMRDLKISLDTIWASIGKITTICGLNRAQDASLTVHIRTLDLHRCVLRSVSSLGNADTIGVDLLSRLSSAASAERQKVMNELVNSFSELSMGVDPREIDSLYDPLPQLPDRPKREQVCAWLEVVEILQDAVFRGRLQWAAARQFDVLSDSGQCRNDNYETLVRLLCEQLIARMDLSIAGDLNSAKEVIGKFAVELAGHSVQNSTEFCSWLLTLPESVSDKRFTRYWELTAIVYDRQPPPDSTSIVNRMVAHLEDVL